MRSRLELAVAACERSPGYLSAGCFLERVQINDNGALLLHFTPPNGDFWMASDGSTVHELRPGADRSLPLSAELSEDIGKGRLEVLAYRPGRRVVLSPEPPDANFVIKGYRRRRSGRAAARHRSAEAAARSPVGFRVPQLVQHCERSSSLRLERIDGRTLRLSADRSESFFAAGLALRAFQDGDPRLKLETFQASDELAVLDRWAERVDYALGKIPKKWGLVRSRLEEVHRRLPLGVFGVAHRDLHDGQFLEADDDLALLDFDLLCRANVALDPGNLLAHLGLRALQGARGAEDSAVQACGRALLDGLDRTESPGFWPWLRFYEATTFLRLSLVYRLRPKWTSLCGDLTELALRCVDELETVT